MEIHIRYRASDNPKSSFLPKKSDPETTTATGDTGPYGEPAVTPAPAVEGAKAVNPPPVPEGQRVTREETPRRPSRGQSIGQS